MDAKVYFPETNPIVFSREGDYEAYKDASLMEFRTGFCQQFHEDDLISFQMRWEKEYNEAFRVELYVVVNGIKHHYGGLGVGRVPAGKLHDFFSLPLRGSEYGVIGFSLKVHEIKVNDNRIIKDGDSFYFQLEIEEKNNDIFEVIDIFVSNELVCKNDISLTKLIHYSYSDSDEYTSFGTVFEKMPKGYDIRLQCSFAPLSQKANKEVFQAYNGTFDLVSAVPYETVTLLIGDKNGIGVPDWLIRNLNYIFHLDEKTIDGVGYELCEGSELEVEIATGYNHRFLKIELSKKESENWRKLGSIVNPPVIIVIYDDTSRKNTGTISVIYDSNFYLQPLEIKDIGNYALSQSSGIGTQQIQFTSINNTTEEDIITQYNMIDKITNEVVGVVELVLPPTRRGICFWKICETFHVAC